MSLFEDRTIFPVRRGMLSVWTRGYFWSVRVEYSPDLPLITWPYRGVVLAILCSNTTSTEPDYRNISKLPG